RRDGHPTRLHRSTPSRALARVRVDLKVVEEGSGRGRVSGVRVPARPPRDRTRAGVAARLEVSRPVRLPARALRFNPPGLDRQAPWVRPRPRDADLVAHLRLPVRHSRVELRTGAVDPPVP